MPNESRYLIAALIFVLSGATDYLDGYIARKLNQISTLGKILDPLADKLTQATVFVCLYIDKIISLWIVIVYIVKEVLVAIGSSGIYKRTKFMVTSRWYGKAATAIFYAGVFLILVADFPPAVNTGIIAVIIAITVFACVMYAVRYFSILKSQGE